MPAMADLQVFDFNEAAWGETYDAPFCKFSGEYHAPKEEKDKKNDYDY